VRDMRLENKVAIVTGGASGIGAAICRAFDHEGAAVAVLDVDGDRAEALAGELRHAITVRADVTSSRDVTAAVGAVVDALGGLDILVNNAGIAADMQRLRRPGGPSRCAVAARGDGAADRRRVAPHARDAPR